MKKIQFIAMALPLFIALAGCKNQGSGSITPCDPTKHYPLIWSEEFNYTGLPDSSKWGYEEGFIRNHESQYYTKGRLENARVENGRLVIESKKESYKGASYTSASINTLGKVSFPVDSRVEVRARIPWGQGIWPAIWMMGTDVDTIGWPKCGEIDIMEFVGHTPGVIWSTFHWWDAAKPDSSIHLSGGSNIQLNDLQSGFHVYGVERTARKLTFFVDNHYFFTFRAYSTVQKDLFNHSYYLLLNTAIGGDWGGKIDDSIFPQKFLIDWVRVFAIKDENSAKD